MRNLILRRARSASALLGRHERGAIGVLVGILIGGGVLVGIGALVVDAGQLYQNRAELQNGADAGALAVAQSCAQGTCTPSAAKSYADSNARSGIAGVNLVCGSGSLGACPASTGKIYDCPAAPPAGTNYVDVHTETETSSGSSLLPPALARTLLGNSSYQGSTVYACAQAEWAAPADATTIGITIPECEWAKATDNGTSYAPTSGQSSAFDQKIQLDEEPSTTCSSTQEADTTTDLTGNCTVAISAGLYSGYVGDPRRLGSGPDCSAALSAAQASHSPVLLPVYNLVDTSGALCGGKVSEPFMLSCWVAPNAPCYELVGYASFVVTGYNYPNIAEDSQSADYLNPANTCSGGSFCLDGYFTQTIVPLGATPYSSSRGFPQTVSSVSAGGADLGASVVWLTG
jgi:Flp pilus assembly protein TadG